MQSWLPPPPVGGRWSEKWRRSAGKRGAYRDASGKVLEGTPHTALAWATRGGERPTPAACRRKQPQKNGESPSWIGLTQKKTTDQTCARGGTNTNKYEQIRTNTNNSTSTETSNLQIPLRHLIRPRTSAAICLAIAELMAFARPLAMAT